MHVNWNWIKQRPHFLAEELNKYFYVDVFCWKNFKRETNYNPKGNLNVYTLLRLPFDSNDFIRKINRKIIKFQIKNRIKRYTYIWLTRPDMFFLIKENITRNQVVIYDCMDDWSGFDDIRSNKKMLSEILDCERETIKYADIIFFSSESLRNTIFKRYNFRAKNTYIANNAISLNTLYEKCVAKQKYKKNKKIGYIGTISAWFDFDLILKSLTLFDNIEYHLYGPSDCTIPKNSRIIYHGTIKHDKIFRVMREMDLLIMPFIINDLIKNVNPVKVYEYIYSCKPSLFIEYSETKQFKDFIFLYKDFDEYIATIKAMVSGQLKIKKSFEEYKAFARKNTWALRGTKIKDIICKHGIYSNIKL